MRSLITPLLSMFVPQAIKERPSPELPAHCSSGLRDLVGRCLLKDPALRPSARELLGHPLLAQLSLDDGDAIVQPQQPQEPETPSLDGNELPPGVESSCLELDQVRRGAESKPGQGIGLGVESACLELDQVRRGAEPKPEQGLGLGLGLDFAGKGLFAAVECGEKRPHTAISNGSISNGSLQVCHGLRSYYRRRWRQQAAAAGGPGLSGFGLPGFDLPGFGRAKVERLAAQLGAPPEAARLRFAALARALREDAASFLAGGGAGGAVPFEPGLASGSPSALLGT